LVYGIHHTFYFNIEEIEITVIEYFESDIFVEKLLIPKLRLQTTCIVMFPIFNVNFYLQMDTEAITDEIIIIL